MHFYLSAEAPKPRIGFDFDGVLTHPVWLKMQWAYNWYGVIIDYTQTKKMAFDAVMQEQGIDADYESFGDRLNDEHIAQFPLSPGCLDELAGLDDDFDFCMITSRRRGLFEHAKRYVIDNVPFRFDPMLSSDDKSKQDVVLESDVDMYVDDDYTKLADLIDLPVLLVYFRQPENAHLSLPENLKLRGILEADSMAQVACYARSYLHRFTC